MRSRTGWGVLIFCLIVAGAFAVFSALPEKTKEEIIAKLWGPDKKPSLAYGEEDFRYEITFTILNEVQSNEKKVLKLRPEHDASSNKYLASEVIAVSSEVKDFLPMYAGINDYSVGLFDTPVRDLRTWDFEGKVSTAPKDSKHFMVNLESPKPEFAGVTVYVVWLEVRDKVVRTLPPSKGPIKVGETIVPFPAPNVTFEGKIVSRVGDNLTFNKEGNLNDRLSVSVNDKKITIVMKY